MASHMTQTCTLRPHTAPEQSQQHKATPPTQVSGGKEKENVSPPSEEKTADSVTGAKNLLSRMMRVAQRYLLDPRGRQKVEEKTSLTQTKPRQRGSTLGRVFKSRTSASLTPAQMKAKRQSQHRGAAQKPDVQGGSGDVTVAPVTVTDTAGKSDRSVETFKRTATGPVGKGGGRRSNHSLNKPMRVKSLHFLRNSKSPLRQTHPSSSIVPSALCSSTLTPSSNGAQTGDQQKDTPRTALIKELSSRHQSSVPFRNIRESKLI
ncbi:hypothetical protein PBY51_012391 [Eleginops maclovinus]|uniref:Uncharacterized protein n=1 Tax=Eleginops maclovinus TaxID=56733 RepID=A0AAN8AUQ3_ELEMC|nr:hypothetical protein PBY51_012391 [Eleginops maclovinus]